MTPQDRIGPLSLSDESLEYLTDALFRYQLCIDEDTEEHRVLTDIRDYIRYRFARTGVDVRSIERSRNDLIKYAEAISKYMVTQCGKESREHYYRDVMRILGGVLLGASEGWISRLSDSDREFCRDFGDAVEERILEASGKDV